jgi:hypothetical protein
MIASATLELTAAIQPKTYSAALISTRSLETSALGLAVSDQSSRHSSEADVQEGRSAGKTYDMIWKFHWSKPTLGLAQKLMYQGLKDAPNAMAQAPS